MGKKKRKKAKRLDWMPKDMQLLSGDTMFPWDGTVVMGQSAGAHIGTFVDEAADISPSAIARLMKEAIRRMPYDKHYTSHISVELIYDQADEAGVSFQRAARWYGIDWKA